jgi:hypothetical protein
LIVYRVKKKGSSYEIKIQPDDFCLLLYLQRDPEIAAPFNLGSVTQQTTDLLKRWRSNDHAIVFSRCR